MYHLEIEDKTYSVPQDWTELKASDFIKWSLYFNENLPSCLSKRQDKKDDQELEPLTEDEELECLRFYNAFCEHCLDADLKKIVVTSEDGWGLIDLYHHLEGFMYVPSEEIRIDSFDFGGTTYKAHQDAIIALGKSQPMKDATFEEWEASATLMNNFSKMGKTMEALPILAAIIYQDGEFDSKKVMDRAEEFKELDMEKVWSAYFFLTEQMTTFNDTLKSYSRQVVKQAASQVSLMDI